MTDVERETVCFPLYFYVYFLLKQTSKSIHNEKEQMNVKVKLRKNKLGCQQTFYTSQPLT